VLPAATPPVAPSPAVSAPPVTTQPPPATPPPITAPAPQGAAPPVPVPGQTVGPNGIAVPEVQVTTPDAVPSKAPIIQTARKKQPVPRRIVDRAPAPVPAPIKQAAPKATTPAAVAVAPKPATVVAAPTPPPAAPLPASQIAAPTPVLGSQVKLSPVGGSEIPIEKYSGSLSTVSAADVQKSGSSNTTDALQQRVPGVIVTDAAGNAFQQEVNFRGFSSGPNNGTAQGLAVYQNGVRINEVFGDTVNWDQIPSVAISDIAVVTGNPVFGLNAIGGAAIITMKDGFTYQGTEIDAKIGSFGRRQASVQHGANFGQFGTYVAVEGVKDDGWRDRSDSLVRRAYADLAYKNTATELHLNFTGASNKLGATAATPIDLITQRYGSIYTSPQTVENKLAMLSFSGAQALSTNIKIASTLYLRKFKQSRVDGNISDVQDCDGTSTDPTALCFGEPDNPLNGTTGLNGLSGGLPYGSIDRTGVDTTGIGGSLQAVDKSKLLGLGNQLLVGGSVDTGKLTSRAASELGLVGPDLVVQGQGIILSDAGFAGGGDTIDAIKPVNLGVTTRYYGLYVSDTLDLTDTFALTLGARFNIAEIKLADKTGISPELDGNSKYHRLNPVIGGAYKVTPNATLFGSYSEANRAPTPAELACADPARPCLLEGFLVADPPLKQVVSRSFEAGLRGNLVDMANAGKLDWSLAVYRTENEDDIISVSAPQQGRGYFQNAGITRRQGVDLALNYKNERFSGYMGYGFVDATFQSNLELSSPNNPNATTNACLDGISFGCIQVKPGDRLAGVPQHRFKAGFDYFLTSKWLVGADLVATSDQVFRGDEDNKNPRLAGYGVVNLRTSYDVTKGLQLYGHINNLFDSRYGLGGTYYNSADLNALTGSAFTDNRTIVPGAPFAAYGGVKVKF
jgi:iron complex outermembrane recepter protein